MNLIYKVSIFFLDLVLNGIVYLIKISVLCIKTIIQL